jgi:hypothetical protein
MNNTIYSQEDLDLIQNELQKDRKIPAFAYYDGTNNNYTINVKHRNLYDMIFPVINDLNQYLSSCNEYDFDKSSGKLRYTETYANNIFSILDKYKNIFNNDDLIYVLIAYSYWFIKIIMRYLEEYFNMKINKKYINSILIVSRYCYQCNKLIFGEVDTIAGKNGLIDFKNSFSEHSKNWVGYYYRCRDPISIGFCEECKKENIAEDDKIRNEKKKNEKEEQEKLLQNLKTMPYKDYLETDHWKSLRKRKLKQSGYKCQICSSTKDLNVHHNTYENRGNEDDCDLVVLCHVCHEMFHGKSQSDTTTIPAFSIDHIKSKLFIMETNNYNDKEISEFLSKVNNVVAIKTNLYENTYTVLLLYK